MTETTAPRRSRLQQERSRDARRRLARAATRLWAERGFDATSVGDICEAADIPRANFYFYFKNKDDLLFELALEGVETFGAAAGDAASAVTTDDALRSFVAAFSERMQLIPPALLDRMVLLLMSRAPEWNEVRGELPGFYTFLRDVVERAAVGGEIHPTLRTDDVALMLGGTLREGLLAWTRRLTDDDALEDLLYRRLRVVLNGATMPPVDPAPSRASASRRSRRQRG